MKTRSLLPCLTLTACVSAPGLPALETDADSETGQDTKGDGEDGPVPPDDDDHTTGAPTTAGTSGTTSDDETGAEATCGTGCTDGDAEVRWIAEPGGDLLGGRCLDVIADGEGGAVASFITDPEAIMTGGLVLALDEGGDEAARASLGWQVEGMERAGPGAFAWVDSTAYAGQSSTALEALDGVALGGGVWAADDVALTTGGTAYSIISGTLLPECRTRMNGTADSDPYLCGAEWDRWRLEPEGDGVAGGLIGQSALVRVGGTGQIAALLDYRYQRTLLDVAAGEDGEVWTVGVIANPNEPGPSYGAFVARHDANLTEDPLWEGIEDGDTSVAWTAIVMHDAAPVLVGRDEDDLPRIVGLTPSGDIAWTLRPDLPPSVLLRQADVDDTGHLVACGERAAATPVVIAVDLP